MHSIVSDLKLIFRQLRKSPGFAATAVLMLAFGIGATTAIFSIVDGVLLRPLPFPSPDRLVTLGDQVSGTDWGQHDSGPVTGPEVVVYPRDTRSFEALGGYGYSGFELSGLGQPAQIVAARMTSSVFSALGVAPLMGRVFTDQEDQQKQQVAVLSYATWKSRFNGNPSILGTKILLDRKPYLIIGVMPRNFEFPLFPGRLNRSELWVPMSLSPQELSPEANASWYLNLVGRVSPALLRRRPRVMRNEWRSRSCATIQLTKQTSASSPWFTRCRKLPPYKLARFCGCSFSPSRSCCSSPAPTLQASYWSVPFAVSGRPLCGSPSGRPHLPCFGK